MIGVPKQPADRNPRLRELAEGEECCVRLFAWCDPSTTVWAHTNTQADQKGLGYKGSDSQGFFACHRCHAVIDQPSGSLELSPGELAYYLSFARARTTARLHEIAANPALRPWKVEAARWALERRD